MHDLKLKGAARNTSRLCIHDENMSACVCVCVCAYSLYILRSVCVYFSLSLCVGSNQLAMGYMPSLPV